MTATWMIRLCEKTRSAGGRCGHGRDGRWLGEVQHELRARLAPAFCQARSRLAAFAYLGALLAAGGEPPSSWQLAQAPRERTPPPLPAPAAEPPGGVKEVLRAPPQGVPDHS